MSLSPVPSDNGRRGKLRRWCVDIDGMEIVIMATGDSDDSNHVAAYIRYPGEDFYLMEPFESDNGFSYVTNCDVYGDTAVFSGDNGEVFVFRRGCHKWYEEQRLSTSFGGGEGKAIAIWGDTIVVGDKYDDSESTNAGAAYVFERSGDTWTQTQKLTASNPDAEACFGMAVDVWDGYLVIGAPYANDPPYADGYVYVFQRHGGTWIENQILSVLRGDDTWLGVDVAIDGYCIAAGSLEDGFGATYVFTPEGYEWTQRDKLQPTSVFQARFGYNIDLDGYSLIVGAYQDGGAGGTNGVGKAYIYGGNDNRQSWNLQSAISNPSPADSGDDFGHTVAIADGYTAIIGKSGTVESEDGIAVVYELNGSWSKQSELEPESGYRWSWGGVAIYKHRT